MDTIGKHCALQSCHALDFLPIQCKCLEWFCKLHISPDLHNCSFVQQHPPNSSTRVRSDCALSGCNKLSLTAGVTAADSVRESELSQAGAGACPGCHLSFCVDHRHLQSHSCTSLTTEKDDLKHEAARATLAQKFPSASTQSYTPVVVRKQRNGLPADSQKLAQLKRVNLMKLRHTATPADPKDKSSVIPVDQRLHIIARLEVADSPAKEVTLWFRKTTMTGKALDLVVLYFGVSPANSTLRLKQSLAETSHVLQNHLSLGDQLEDGSTVVLTDELPRQLDEP